MDNKNIALRAQDFHEALKVTTTSGAKDVYFEKTLLIGKAAVLAMHFRGMLYVENMESLKYAAAELGIAGLELPTVLNHLQEVDFLRIANSAHGIKRIDIRVPEFRSGYEDLGRYWTNLKPSEIEVAGVTLLDRLMKLPIAEGTLAQEGMDATCAAIIKDVMGAGELIRSQTVSGQSLLYTPLAVDNNPLPYLQWANKYKDQVGVAIEKLRSFQGLPVSSLAVQGNPLLEDAVLTGVLMPVQINGATGSQQFLFAPKGGIPNEERVILDKARAILACVRYGQNYAAGRPIKYPRAILRQLRDHKQFSKGHPDLNTQYGLLVEKMIGYPFQESGGYWNLKIYDTDENMKALEIAIDMLEMGETPGVHINVDAQKAILSPQGYLGPTSVRPRLAKTIHGSPATRADMFNKISDLIRGASLDVH